jgi:hypothetical protein
MQQTIERHEQHIASLSTQVSDLHQQLAVSNSIANTKVATVFPAAKIPAPSRKRADLIITGPVTIQGLKAQRQHLEGLKAVKIEQQKQAVQTRKEEKKHRLEQAREAKAQQKAEEKALAKENGMQERANRREQEKEKKVADKKRAAAMKKAKKLKKRKRTFMSSSQVLGTCAAAGSPDPLAPTRRRPTRTHHIPARLRGDVDSMFACMSEGCDKAFFDSCDICGDSFCSDHIQHTAHS